MIEQNEELRRLYDELFRPPTPDATIWRYMNFTKFMSLLEEQALYLSRADHLGDSFESSFPRANFDDLDKFQYHVPDVDKDTDPDLYEARRREIAENNNRFFVEMSQEFGRSVFVNCWHEREHESGAMWGLYLKGADGIAIRTTAKRLSESIHVFPEILDLGTVRYIDYDKERLDEGNVFNLVLHKRHHFEHEKEVRVIHWLRQPAQPDGPVGILVRADLPLLIEKIVITPTASESFHQLLLKILKRYGLDVCVEASKLAERPLR
jgi:hypothetical protein